jgi:DNA-binding transcriptional LysR family regulator
LKSIMKPDSWLGVELRHLAALQAVAREGSFGGAAVSLGYSQSAVSQQIAALERIVGERLIERPGGPRPVSLTDAGKLLLGHADGIVARLEAAQADLAAYSQGSAGTLRVGTYQSVGARVLPRVMLEFAQAWPLVSIQLTESSDDSELLALVERGELDLTFVMLPVDEGPFSTRQLMEDPYVLVVRADSPLADSKRPPTLAEIAALPLIGYRQCRSVIALEARFRGTGLEPEIVFRSDDNGTIQGMVAAGVGAALVPWLAVEARDKSVVALPVDARIPPRKIGIAWHKDRYHAPAARAFVGVAEEVCAEIEAEQGGRRALVA